MKHIAFSPKEDPEYIMRIWYGWDQDIKFIASVSYMMQSLSDDQKMMMMINAVNGLITKEEIMAVFEADCNIIPDAMTTLEQDHVTVADLFLT